MSAIPMETSYLWPGLTFLLLLFLVFAVLVAWPLLESLRDREFGWAVAILLFAPLGGVVWVTRRLVRRGTRGQV